MLWGLHKLIELKHLEQRLSESKCSMSLVAVTSSVCIFTLLNVTHLTLCSRPHFILAIWFPSCLWLCLPASGIREISRRGSHNKLRLWWVGHLARLRQEGRLYTSIRSQGILSFWDEERLWQTADASWSWTLGYLYLLCELFVLSSDFSLRRYREAALFIPWSVHSLQIHVPLNVNSFFEGATCPVIKFLDKRNEAF